MSDARWRPAPSGRPILRRRPVRRLVAGLAVSFPLLATAAGAEPVEIAQAEAAKPDAAQPDAKPAAPSGEKAPSRPPPGIEEIVIRGTESEASEDFAAGDSVTGFGAEDLAALGAQDIADIAGFTPNLEIVTSGATTPTFFIRGVGLNDFNANSTGSVAIYQDDVAINAPAMQLGTLYDVEAVNVLRGPQGTGPARNASAGAIKIYSRKPSGEYGSFLRSDLGNYNFRDFEGALEAPVYEDMLSARLAFRYSERDGWLKNRCGNAPPMSARVETPSPAGLRAVGKQINDGPWSICGEPVPSFTKSPIPVGLEPYVNNLHNWAARGTLLFEPTLDTSFLLSAHGSRRDELTRLGTSYGTNGLYQYQTGGTQIEGLLGAPQGTIDVPGYQAPEVKARWYELAPCIQGVPGRPQGTCALIPGGNELENYAKITTANELAADLDSEPFRGDFNLTGPTTNDVWGGYLRGEAQLPLGIELTSVTGYDTYDRLIDIDLDFSPQTLFHIKTEDSGWQVVQDLRLEGQVGDEVPVRWNVGGWFLREKLDVFINNDFGRGNVVAIGTRDYTQELWSTAGYFGLSWDFWKDFTLDGGFRYNWERKSIDYLLLAGSLPFSQSLDNTWHAPTGTIRLTYRFREDTHVYWKYTRGWKPGTYNATSSINEGVTAAEPETIDAFESGVSGSWLEGRLGIDFSMFYYNYENYQLFTAQQYAGGQPEFVILNAPKAEVYGAELDAVLRPWIGAFVNVRFGWLESQFLDFVQLQQTNDFVRVGGARLPVVITKELNNTGNNLLNSPRFKVSLTGEQTVPLGRYGSLTARYDGVWTDTTYYDATEGKGLPNNQLLYPLPNGTTAQKPYWVHNLRVGYRPPGGRVEIAGWVRNLTNEAYKTFAFDGSTFNKTTIYFIGEPRTFGGTLVVNF